MAYYVVSYGWIIVTKSDMFRSTFFDLGDYKWKRRMVMKEIDWNEFEPL